MKEVLRIEGTSSDRKRVEESPGIPRIQTGTNQRKPPQLSHYTASGKSSGYECGSVYRGTLVTVRR